MDDKFLQIEFKVRSMQAQILQHFSGFDEVIKQAVEEACTPQNIIESVLKEVKSTLAWKIARAIDEVVATKIRSNEQINHMVATTIATQLNEPRSATKPKKQRNTKGD